MSNTFKKNTYFDRYFQSLFSNIKNIDIKKLEQFIEIILNSKKNLNKLIIVGNGGSASIASHVSVDFIKAAKITCLNFNEPNLITCFSNDYGYENWVSEALKIYAEKEHV